MKPYLVAIGVVALVIGYVLLASVWLHGQTVQYRAAESYMPETITIKRELPDRTRLCVEPPGGGLLACKPLGAVREWVFASKAK